MVGPCPCGTYHSNGQQCCSAPLAYYSPYDDAGDYSPSVDCTLSLGTPATRRSSERQDRRTSGVGDFQHQYNSSSSSSHSKAGGHPLLPRRCANCDTTSTPLWRNGPRGPKSLCNACGIRYKKEERRATAAAAANAAASGGGGFTDSAGYYQYFSPPAAMGNEYGYMDDQADGRDSDSGTQFVTWSYDVTGQAYHQPCP